MRAKTIRMRFRPRYSLLTLLVLTALIAGGVKLWRGPHRVVERKGYYELEYTYTRDLTGKQMRGPLVRRLFWPAGKPRGVFVGYCRNGTMLAYVLLRQADELELLLPEDRVYSVMEDVDKNSLLTAAEKHEWKAAIEQERQQHLQGIRDLREVYQEISE